MHRYGTFLRIVGCGVLSVSFLAGAAFLYGVPSHPASVFAFKLGYHTSWDKAGYLRYYSPVRRDVGGGYIPPEVDLFLCEKLETAKDLTEIEAIVGFYVFQGGGRRGDCVYKVSNQSGERIATVLVRTITSAAESTDVSGEITVLEEVLQQRSFGKGGLNRSAISADRPTTPEEWEKWKHEKAIPIARQKYLEWWDLDIPWAEKKAISPLAGTEIAVHHCC
jgi:hypothetical protein